MQCVVQREKEKIKTALDQHAEEKLWYTFLFLLGAVIEGNGVW